MSFYIPFLYFIKTRLRQSYQKVSYIFIYFFPVFYFVFLLGGSWIEALGAILLIYSVYELGYMFNDTISEKYECNKTSRLTFEESNYFIRHRWYIVCFRLLCASIICFFMIEKLQSFILIPLILTVFYFYNTGNVRFRLLLHFLLVTIRYVSPFILSVGFQLPFILYLVLIFPLHNSIERLREDKFGFSSYIKNFFLFNTTSGRFIYYFLLSLVSIIFYFNGLYVDLSFIVLCLLFMAYRLSGMFVVSLVKPQ